MQYQTSAGEAIDIALRQICRGSSDIVTQDKNEIVRREAAHSLGAALPNISEKHREQALPAWSNLHCLTQDKGDWRCDLQGDWRCDLPAIRHLKGKLTGADLSNANLSGALFAGLDLSNINFTGASLIGASLVETDLSGANLNRANLRKAFLNRAKLIGANFNDADLSDVDLTGADLSGAIFSGANLAGAKLTGAKLIGAKLIGAKFIGANLNGTDLSLIDFSRVEFSDVDLSQAKISGEKISVIIQNAVFQADRYTKVDFPTKCAINEKIELSIQLTLKQPMGSVIRQLLKIPFPNLETKVVLTLVVTATDFQLDNHRITMNVPIDDDSEVAYFQMRPLSLGKLVAEVEIFCNAMRIGYFGIETQVLDTESKSVKPSNITLYENPAARIANAYTGNPPNQINIDRTLHVIWDSQLGLSFSIYHHSGEIEGDWKNENIGTKEEIKNSLSNIATLIADIAKKKYLQDEDKQSVMGNMKGMGENLFQRLLPKELSKKAYEWQSGTTLCISTNEPWIPWEMLNDGKGFWGQRFLLFRLPRLQQRDLPLDTQRKETLYNQTQANVINKVVHVIGGDISNNCANRAKAVFESISNRVSVETLEQKNFAFLMKQSSGADLLHFTCHGYEDYLQISEKLDKQINLLITSIKNQDFVIRDGSIIFANACGSSLPQVIFGDFVSFGWEFYKKGAAIFIGTIGTIPTKSAIAFAEAFYSALFEGNGGLCTASLKAKEAHHERAGGFCHLRLCTAFSKAKYQMEKEDNFWYLLYCLYGNPVCSNRICLKD